jgi:sortase A
MTVTRRVNAVAAFMALSLGALVACGSSSDKFVETVLPVTTTTAPASTTTTATTTTSIDGSGSTTTTSTTLALPTPMPSPADAFSVEPDVVLGTIEIPKIGVSKTLRDGVRLTTLDKGPGHWPGSALPGQIGNMVVAGHRVTHDKPFRNLDKLSVGDEVRITLVDRSVVHYRVTSTEIVPNTALDIVDQTTQATGTLFACHPPGSARQRIVVHLALAPS